MSTTSVIITAVLLAAINLVVTLWAYVSLRSAIRRSVRTFRAMADTDLAVTQLWATTQPPPVDAPRPPHLRAV